MLRSPSDNCSGHTADGVLERYRLIRSTSRAPSVPTWTRPQFRKDPMSAHEVFSQHVDVRSGFATYSVLLIPDYEWFSKTPLESAFRIFSRFADFGRVIGEDHLACWFYRTSGGYTPDLDTDVVATVHGCSTVAELTDLVNAKCAGDYPLPLGHYDAERARLICSALSLEYARGPFIAFFSSRPALPRWEIDSKVLMNRYRQVLAGGEEVTPPDLILRFGGLDVSRSLRLLDELERALLSDRVPGKSFRLKEIGARVEQWCQEHHDALADIVRSVVVRRVGGPESS
jgi:hypothetical protein